MKKSLILRIAFLGLFLAGLGLYGNSGQLIAQSGLDNSLFDEPQVTFVSKQIASERIDNSIVLLKILLENLTHGSPEYNEIFAKYTYSVSVQNFFINGQTIPQAIVEGLKLIVTDEFNLPKPTPPVLKQQMVDLLKA